MNPKSFNAVLQDTITLDDRAWDFQIPNLPSQYILDTHNLVKTIVLITNAEKRRQEIRLRLESLNTNRAVAGDPPSRFLVVSALEFRPLHARASASGGPTSPSEEISGNHPATGRECTEYLIRLLRAGVRIQGTHYNFYGHSNSQLKSRTCFLFAASRDEIAAKVAALGDFSGLKTVAKMAKRIGLLFSTSRTVLTIDPARCEDIPDIELDGYTFTDGCGLIAPRLAQDLARRTRVVFRNTRYTPSVFQIRYRGYKGVVTVDPRMKPPGPVLKLRKSMKKFSGGGDYSFAVVEHSRPFVFGYLNDEIVILLQFLGIHQSVFLRKQQEHFGFLAAAQADSRSAFRFLSYLNRPDLAEKVLMTSLEDVRPAITKLVNSEYDKMLNKRDEQKCRILVPQSRLLFGVCDAWGVLKEGECAVRVTRDGDGQPYALSGMEILVTRNPCLHPGDLQKFKVVQRDELSHLTDCIIFSTRGKRPAADLMSGGDLDGDTFFVCWDPDLIPRTISQPAEYPGGREPLNFKPILDDDRLVYFAKHTNASLGRVKILYLDWAKVLGPMSPQCQELNRLFSQCVDGNRIKVPQKLENAPTPTPETAPFILDALHDAARRVIEDKGMADLEGYTFDALELLLSRDHIPRSDYSLEEFLHLFDFNLLTAEEKAWVMTQLPPSADSPSLVMNALYSSDLLNREEIDRFQLGAPGIRWKTFYTSSRDRLATFLEAGSKALGLFHKKLLMIRVDERLTVAIYVPQKIEASQDCLVDDRVRLLAFPHSHGGERRSRLALPTKKRYRLYCDGSTFQLFENQRGNTWIFIGRAASDDSSYRGIENKGDRRRQRQATLDQGNNFDFRVSIALDKFSRGLQTHVGRVNRSGVSAAEIYVINNRDMKSMRTLDLWLQHIDTEEKHELFEKTPKEYVISMLRDVDWSSEQEHIAQIAKFENVTTLRTLKTTKAYRDLVSWLLERDQKALLIRCHDFLLSEMRDGSLGQIEPKDLLWEMLGFLGQAPFLALCFSKLEDWNRLPEDMTAVLDISGAEILRAFVLAVEVNQTLVVAPFRTVLSQVKSLTLDQFADVVELISLTVQSPDIALDLLLECLEAESTRLLTGRPAVIRHFVHSVIGIALDHIGEVREGGKTREGLLELRPCSDQPTRYPLVEVPFRIDTPGGTPEMSAHVRFFAAGPPTNSASGRRYTIDAIVRESQQGMARFECFHPLPPFYPRCSWRMRYCGSFVTAAAMFDAARKLATQSDDCCPIVNEVLGTRGWGPVAKPKEEDGDAFPQLNSSQAAAVHAAVRNSLTLIWGPPGTGKTQTIVRKVAAELRKYTCDAMAGQEIYNDHAAMRQAKKKVKESRLIFTTCMGAGLGLLRGLSFGFVIIDEASQQTEPASLVPLTKGCCKAILVGDHVQLRPTVRQHATSVGFDVSLFERLYRNEGRGAPAKVMLDTQYRMHPRICSFISEQFYDSKLLTGISERDRVPVQSAFPWPEARLGGPEKQIAAGGVPPPRMVFLECAAREELGQKSKLNKAQGEMCLRVCQMLLASDGMAGQGRPAAAQSIAVLTPYTRQAEFTKQLLSGLTGGIEVSSIDGFQGREADIVVFITVRCNENREIGFLTDMRRMNVALTRCRSGLIVIGNRATLTGAEPELESTIMWRRLLNHAAETSLPTGTS
ncbi:hypothetical protein ACRALDRAFT_2056344 [Sodiomyces alcalophilus JCM 7366]|uniref:uncharacterized protein n=1 Tax=Sodiomyces alcalophilus JCM 7366 TaxID=591952 RepID=UPI0039B45037